MTSSSSTGSSSLGFDTDLRAVVFFGAFVCEAALAVFFAVLLRVVRLAGFLAVVASSSCCASSAFVEEAFPSDFLAAFDVCFVTKLFLLHIHG